MSQVYEIEIKEELSRVEKVEADSLDEAISKAIDLYYGQKVILDAEDMKGVDFHSLQEEHEKTR